MKIIIGLGNIGREYENTRHNAGFMAIDKLAQMLEMDFNQEKFSAYFAKKKIPVLNMEQETKSLEDVFLQLTGKESEAAK